MAGTSAFSEGRALCWGHVSSCGLAPTPGVPVLSRVRVQATECCPGVCASQERTGVKMVMIQDGPLPTGADKPLRITGDPFKVQVGQRLGRAGPGGGSAPG